VVQQSRESDLGGFLGTQLGDADPVAGYFAYTGTVVGIVVCAFAVLSVLSARHDEAAGFTDLVRSTGARRWGPLAWRIVAAAAGSLVLLVTAAVLSAVVAPAFIQGGDDVALRAATYAVGQWPAALAVAGWTALLVGIRPRLSWLAWAPLLAGATLALLGRLLGIPGTIVRLGIFQHVPDAAAPGPDLRGLALLAGIAAGAGLIGLVAVTRRDLSTR
jgi:ABC-2 type transport system permease protein